MALDSWWERSQNQLPCKERGGGGVASYKLQVTQIGLWVVQKLATRRDWVLFYVAYIYTTIFIFYFVNNYIMTLDIW